MEANLWEFAINRGYLVFFVKDQNLFHRVDTIGNIFLSGKATRENITNGCSRVEINFDLSPKKKKKKPPNILFISCF